MSGEYSKIEELLTSILYELEIVNGYLKLMFHEFHDNSNNKKKKTVVPQPVSSPSRPVPNQSGEDDYNPRRYQRKEEEDNNVH